MTILPRVRSCYFVEMLFWSGIAPLVGALRTLLESIYIVFFAKFYRGAESVVVLSCSLSQTEHGNVSFLFQHCSLSYSVIK